MTSVQVAEQGVALAGPVLPLHSVCQAHRCTSPQSQDPPLLRLMEQALGERMGQPSKLSE